VAVCGGCAGGRSALKPLFMTAIALAGFITILYTVMPELPVFTRMQGTFERLSRQKNPFSSWNEIEGTRWQIWRRGWEVIREKPWLGHGVGTYLIESRKLSLRFPVPTTNDYPGNYYLHVWAEMGFVGMSWLLLFFFGTGIRGLEAVRKDENLLRIFVLAAYSGMLISLFFGSHLMRLEVGLLFWVTVFFLWQERLT